MMADLGVAKLQKEQQKEPRQAPKPAKKLPPMPPQQLQGEVRRLQDRGDALAEQLASAQAASAADQSALAGLRADVAAAVVRSQQDTVRVDAAETLHKSTAEALTEARRQLARTQSALAAAQRQQAKAVREAVTHEPAATDARGVLRRRSLVIASEQEEAISALAQQRPADLLDALLLADPQPLASLLAERVVLAGPAAEVPERADRVVVRVAEQRCEVGGASDVDAAWLKFAAACSDNGVATVTIVGGSVPYRKALRQLAEPHGDDLRLNLVSGTKRRAKRKSESDLRGSDMVLVWGGTELDHAVSGAYTDARSDKVVAIAHRGLSGMIVRATREVQAYGDRRM